MLAPAKVGQRRNLIAAGEPGTEGGTEATSLPDGPSWEPDARIRKQKKKRMALTNALFAF